MPPVMFKRGYTAQKKAGLYIDAAFVDFIKQKNPMASAATIRDLRQAFKRGLVIGAVSIKDQIQMMSAVATGFMRKSVTYDMIVNVSGGKFYMEGRFGTKAWYDILVHEGLGRHGGQSTIPSEYAPTQEQLAIVEPDAETRKRYYKPSPKRPRPFLVRGVDVSKGKMMNAWKKGLMKALSRMKGKGGSPSINIQTVLGGGTIG